MDILLIKGADVMMGIEQNEYLTVPLRSGTELVETEDGGTREVPNRTAAFKPTPEELKKLNEGASLHIVVLGTSWAPMKMIVQDPPLPGHEPDDAPYDQGDKVQAEGLKPGQFVMGTEAGAVTVTDRADPCTLRVGDEISRIEEAQVVSLRYAIQATSYLISQGYSICRMEIVRGGHVMTVNVALSVDGDSLERAASIEPVDRGPIGHSPSREQ